MKTRTLAGLAVLALLSVLLLTLAVSAQGSEPMSQPAPAGAASAPAGAEGLGEPGLNYRPVRTYGITGEPYLDTPNHLNQPYGLFMDSNDHLYTVEWMGNRLLKYGPAGNLLLKIGKAGVCGP